MRAREGFPQISPVFAPIIGRRMMYIEQSPILTRANKKEIRELWNGENEDAHYKILRKLLKLGAGVNAHDIGGNTALDYASMYPDCDRAVPILLHYGADPNLGKYEFQSTLQIYVERLSDKPQYWSVLDLLLNSNAKPKDYDEEDLWRTSTHLILLQRQENYVLKVRMYVNVQCAEYLQ